MFAPKSFFSFTEISDPTMHSAYNEWHQLEHRPENLRLPGVAWGERWVHAPDCARLSTTGDATFADLHYVNMYWFREPVDAATTAWSALAEQSFQWGGRADVHIAKRLTMDFFRPIRGYVSARVRVPADVLPFRPNRGVHLTVSRVDQPRSSAAEHAFRRHDAERMPAVLACRGVAGAWTFAGESAFTTALDLTGTPPAPVTRIELVYLDDDPLEAASQIGELPSADPSVETVLFAGPLRAITPWDWDWFD